MRLVPVPHRLDVLDVYDLADPPRIDNPLEYPRVAGVAHHVADGQVDISAIFDCLDYPAAVGFGGRHRFFQQNVVSLLRQRYRRGGMHGVRGGDDRGVSKPRFGGGLGPVSPDILFGKREHFGDPVSTQVIRFGHGDDNRVVAMPIDVPRVCGPARSGANHQYSNGLHFDIVHPPRPGDKDSGAASVELFPSRRNAASADESRRRRKK